MTQLHAKVSIAISIPITETIMCKINQSTAIALKKSLTAYIYEKNKIYILIQNHLYKSSVLPG